MSSGPEMSSGIRKYWDAAAETYASLDLFNSTQRQCEAWSLLLARIFPPEQPLDIIDVGCGSGFVSLSLAQLGHRVTGLDISSEMLRMCRARADARGLTNLTLALGEAENPPAGIGPADAVVSRHVLWTLPQPESAVTAWVDLTKPGGRILGIDSLWSPQLISDMNGQDYPVEVTRSLPLLHARDLEPVRNVWRRAGLENVMVEYLAWIDEALRAEASPEMAMMCRDLRFYLIEGTPAGTSGGRRAPAT